MTDRLRVGMLAPVAWRVPPLHYGPWERVVSILTEGLVARGVDVTLFATADLATSSLIGVVAGIGLAARHMPVAQRGRRGRYTRWRAVSRCLVEMNGTNVSGELCPGLMLPSHTWMCARCACSRCWNTGAQPGHPILPTAR